MNAFWTSTKPIKGLRHFVLLDTFKKRKETFFLLVAVLDDEINLEVKENEFLKNSEWEKGWLELSKSESITEDYLKFKASTKNNRFRGVFLRERSPFYIS